MTRLLTGTQPSAATGNAWGISGPSFLGLFALLGLGSLTLAAACRWMVRNGAHIRTDADLSGLTEIELAYLNGGERLAVIVARALLRELGILGSDAMVRRMPTIADHLEPVARAVYAAQALAKVPLTTTDLQCNRAVSAKIAELRSTLESRALVMTARARRCSNLPIIVPAVVFVLGAVRVNAGLNADKPVNGLIGEMIALAFGAVALVFVGTLRTRSRAGDRGLRTVKARQAHLDPKLNPSWTTYGARSAVLATAVYGAYTLWSVDPRFAAVAQVPMTAAGTGGSSGCGGGGCGGGGGGGCGGGGCGG